MLVGLEEATRPGSTNNPTQTWRSEEPMVLKLKLIRKRNNERAQFLLKLHNGEIYQASGSDFTCCFYIYLGSNLDTLSLKATGQVKKQSGFSARVKLEERGPDLFKLQL